VELPNKKQQKEYKKLQQYEFAINSHKENNNTQRNSFFNSIKELKNQEAILLMDFKENVKLGGSPREVSKIFYTKSQRTIFCICVITANEHHYFDFISEDLTHDSEFVSRAIRYLISTNEFKKLLIENVSFWSDEGKHFRCGETQNFYQDLFLKKVFKTVSFNYFVEYHGKSYCDSHFSVISNIIEKYESSVDQIKSTTDLINIFKKSFS
jgi:hypothetical protein